MIILPFKIALWIFLWIITWIIFVDYLPSNSHFEYMGLVSPFVLLTLLFSGSGLTSNAYVTVIIPGVIFWSVIVLIIYIHRKRIN